VTHYLVVAHGIEADELVTCLRRLAADDARGVFTLLETATHPLQAFTGHTRELEDLALGRVREAQVQLRAAGVYLVRVLAGDGSVLTAVADEVRARPETYDAVALCTPRPGWRAWLMGDLRTQLEAREGLPVLHLHAGASDVWGRAPRPRNARVSRWWALTRLAPSTEEAGRGPMLSRRDLRPVLGLLCVYLVGCLGLAIGVNRGFLLNDAIAIVVYSVVIGGLFFALRSEA
jgi:hypothetical protein